MIFIFLEITFGSDSKKYPFLRLFVKKNQSVKAISTIRNYNNSLTIIVLKTTEDEGEPFNSLDRGSDTLFFQVARFDLLDFSGGLSFINS